MAPRRMPRPDLVRHVLVVRAESALGVGDGETTEDGLFSIKEVACLGCCSLSPVMMINGVAYGSLTPEKAKRIVREIRDANDGKGA